MEGVIKPLRIAPAGSYNGSFIFHPVFIRCARDDLSRGVHREFATRETVAAPRIILPDRITLHVIHVENPCLNSKCNGYISQQHLPSK